MIRPATALIVASYVTAGAASATPLLIDSSGPNHNGVRLHIKAVEEVASMDGSTTGSRVVVAIECRKNHGGNVKGYGAAVLTNLADPSVPDQKVTLSCDEDGPNKPFSSNSSVNVDGSSASIMIRNMSPTEVRRDYAVIGKVERNSSGWFEAEWSKLEDRFGDVAKEAFIGAGMTLIPLG